jgi:hypothetical protein
MLRAFAIIAACLIAATAALAEDAPSASRYRQSAAVLEKYPMLKVDLTTPALEPGRTALTTQDEMESFIISLAKPNAPLAVHILATTPLGRKSPLLYLTKERHIDAAAIRATGRPIVWLIGQQHGNEPASGEAMLALAHALSEGELRPLLDRIAVVIVPRANPDGAADDSRDTAARMDMNRDHASFQLPEARAIHAAMQELPPDIVIDAHEFAVASHWLEKFAGLHAADLMVLPATHPHVPQAMRQLADELFLPVIERAASAHGLRTVPYHTTGNRREDRSVVLGGNAPGIARNAFGLMGAVSILLESRGVGIGLESYQRRVATHYVAIKAVLEATAANAPRIKSAVQAARLEISNGKSDIVIGHSLASKTITLGLLDPATAATRDLSVATSDSRTVTTTQRRARPAGYIVLRDANAAEHIRLLGGKACRVDLASEIDTEIFDIRDRVAPDRRAINPDAGLKVTVTARRQIIPPGSLYVPLRQPAAHRLMTALEPDAPGSLMAVDVVKLLPGRTNAPVMRVLDPQGLQLTPIDIADQKLCTTSR